MTSTLLSPPPLETPPRTPPVAPGFLSGALAGAAAAVVGLLAVALPVTLAWWADDRADAPFLDAVRVATQTWLAAHGATTGLGWGELSLTPLGLTVVVGTLLWRAGRRVAAQTELAPLAVGAAVGLPYAALVGVAAGLVHQPPLQPRPLETVLCALALALGLATASAARTLHAGLLLPPRLGRVLTASATGVLALVAAAGALVALALTLRFTDAADLASATSPGAVGGLGLVVLTLAYFPTVVVWALAWLAGTGFAVGSGTTVTPFEVAVGPLPALPLAAALPAAPPPGLVAWLVLLVPVAAGLLAGRVVLRDAGRLLDVVATGVTMVGAVWVLAALARGSVGGARLSVLGPDPVAVALAAGAGLAVGLGVSFALARTRRGA